MPEGSQFTRKGKPDAGVECYWTLPTTEEMAWQAKYFLTLDTTQWAQLDESVKTARDKLPVWDNETEYQQLRQIVPKVIRAESPRFGSN